MLVTKNMLATALMEDFFSQTGNTWIEKKVLTELFKKKGISANLDNLFMDGVICCRALKTECYYTLPKYEYYEHCIACDIIRIMSNYVAPRISDETLEKLIREVEIETGKQLHSQQKAAVKCAIRNGVCVITGGPGTGKTCTLQTLEKVMQRISYRLDLRYTAPTGKAARRITESTGKASKTVQKELGITYDNPIKMKFGGNVLIIDEVSMLDSETAFHVFRAIANGQKIILVGDIDQLPSVGPGAVLRDLIWSEVVPTLMLTKTFRQANDSNLFANIMAIRNGEWRMKQGSDFDVIKTSQNSDNAVDVLSSLFEREVKQYGIKNVAMLLPYRKAGKLCSDYMNNVLQNLINPIGGHSYMSCTTESGLTVRFTKGDPVMQLKNRPECVNGDVGFVNDVYNGKLFVKYADGASVCYTKSDIGQLSLAYSMSINKSQGSEYKSVIMGITMAHKAMLNRNILYTGITRAKEKVTLLQEDAAMVEAIKNEVSYSRITFLPEMLLEEYKKLFAVQNICL